ncbi:DUF6115 domain-containing protein [Aquibacillus rhizosphaerae]|uniref:Uncharacterized protein n=1 Tax=Aquibacillus rhizosphaerae TaxID=3051431 RepID=A0ABT7L2J9_9BACI|nr:hypothetical protein [Aquibacillus sp. LR5S19]MDL4840090.1 hypothetical protein [Aquibacillus sp. LR5S19]
MTSILFLVSFLLHVMTFIFLKTLKDKVNLFDDLEAKQKSNIKEMEDLLAVYLIEIKEENDKLLHVLKENEQPKPRLNTKANHVDIQSNPKNNTKYELTSKPVYEDEMNKSKDYKEYSPPVDNNGQDVLEQSVASRVYSLHNQGNSVETIAKKLDCGKTEVELMLKFHRKNS